MNAGHMSTDTCAWSDSPIAPDRTLDVADGGRYGWPADKWRVGANRQFARNVRRAALVLTLKP